MVLPTDHLVATIDFIVPEITELLKQYRGCGRDCGALANALPRQVPSHRRSILLRRSSDKICCVATILCRLLPWWSGMEILKGIMDMLIWPHVTVLQTSRDNALLYFGDVTNVCVQPVIVMESLYYDEPCDRSEQVGTRSLPIRVTLLNSRTADRYVAMFHEWHCTI